MATVKAASETPGAPEAPPRYRVTAPYLTVKTGGLAGILPGRGGYAIVGLYRDAVLPVDAPAEDVERFLADGMVEVVPA